MPFFGQYTVSVKNGTIRLPWPADALKSFSWYLSEASDRKHLIIYVTSLGTPDPEFDHILESNALVLNKNGRWKLPDAFLNYLGDRCITICGINEYFEVCAEDYYEQQMEMIDELFGDLTL